MHCDHLPALPPATLRSDSRMLLTACDDMHINMYDVENQSLVEAFSGVGVGALASCAFHSFSGDAIAASGGEQAGY